MPSHKKLELNSKGLGPVSSQILIHDSGCGCVGQAHLPGAETLLPAPDNMGSGSQ